MKKSWHLSFICSAFVMAILVPTITSGQSSTELFSLLGEMKRGEKRLSTAAIRQQSIQLRLAKLDPLQNQEIEIPVLDGKTYKAFQRPTEGFVRHNAHSYSWTGKIYGEGGWSGDVVLSVYQNAMAGLIYTPSGVYSIIPQADGAHVLVEIRQSLFPDNNNDVQIVGGTDLNTSRKPLKARSVLSDTPLSPQVDNGSLIDIMIVYTDDVRTFLGGTAQAAAFALQAITVTNTAYANSGITPRLRLVHSMELNYAESSNANTHLDDIRANAAVATARDTFKADAVGFFTETSGAGNCGLAGLMANGNHNPAFESAAFGVSKRECAVDNMTFPHELGHNQGANHDPANGIAPASAVFTFAFGHFNVAANFRTVMSTQGNACGACPRVAHFSNPAVNFNAAPTGTADANNKGTIDGTALIFSQFRTSVPTAAAVSVSGRVLSPGGRGLTNAVVTITDSKGMTRSVITFRSGRYLLDDVEVGETYVIAVRSRRYVFIPKVVNIVDDLTDVDFVGQ